MRNCKISYKLKTFKYKKMYTINLCINILFYLLITICRYTNMIKFTKVSKYLYIYILYKVKYLVVGLAVGAVLFKFESKDKSSHSENNSEWCSVGVCRTYFKLKTLIRKKRCITIFNKF